MTNDKNDDLDGEFGDGFSASFDESGMPPPRTLKDMWSESVPFKIGVVVAGIAVISLAVLLFSGGKKDPEKSQVPSSSRVSSTPGTESVSQDYVDRLEEKDKQNFDTAIKTGGSAIPVVIDPPTVGLPLPENSAQEEDPLQRWRELQEQSKKRAAEQQQAPQVVASVPQENPQAVSDLAGVMSEQMANILDARSENKPAKQKTINSKKWLDGKLAENKKLEEEANATKQAEKEESEKQDQVIIIPTGEIEYSQLLIEANSDVQGPVMAQLASGPLKGSRIIGSFEVQYEYLTLKFDTIVIDGIASSIDAIALDPSTTLPGMATEVDHRYFKRIVLPAAAAFVEGMATAAADTVTSIAVTGDTVVQERDSIGSKEAVAAGLAELGSSVREEMDDIADATEVLVKIHAGTPLGILFLEPVFENNETIQKQYKKDDLDKLRDEIDGRFDSAGKKINDRFNETDRRNERNNRNSREDRYNSQLNRNGIYRIR